MSTYGIRNSLLSCLNYLLVFLCNQQTCKGASHDNTLPDTASVCKQVMLFMYWFPGFVHGNGTDYRLTSYEIYSVFLLAKPILMEHYFTVHLFYVNEFSA